MHIRLALYSTHCEITYHLQYNLLIFIYTCNAKVTSMDVNMNKKVTCEQIKPNPLIEEWLYRMYEDAKLRKSCLQGMLEEALNSLAKYPLPLKSGAECMILKGFDRRLCGYLDKLLKQINNEEATDYDNSDSDDSSESDPSPIPLMEDAAISNILSIPCIDLTDQPESSPNPDTDSMQQIPVDEDQHLIALPSLSTENTIKQEEKPRNKTKRYKPAHRSGAYAILVALLEQSLEDPSKAFLTKEDLIEKAQKHSEESFVRPKPDTFYTAWASMTTLVKKGLVIRHKKKKAEFMLTEDGKALAREILDNAKSIPPTNDIIFKNIPSTNTGITSVNNVAVDNEIPSTSGDKNVIEMAPGTFDIILLIDKNEVGGLGKKNNSVVARFKQIPYLKHEYRSLKVGDYTWIARARANPDQELILPYIAERKRMDDLGASIKDGRFHEQKFRLRKCGIPNVLYLIENYGKNKNVRLPLNSLKQALHNTRVQDGFKVHITDSFKRTVIYLALMSSRLIMNFRDKHLRGRNDEPDGEMWMTFDYFNKSSAKTKPLTVTETFIKILLQLKGLSVDKALAITKEYPTPHSLIQAYANCSKETGELLLARLKYCDENRNVGPVISKAIYQLFSSSDAE